MMAQLGERDLALLSTLMYCSAVVNYDGERLSKLVSDLLNDTKGNKLGELELYGEFSYIKSQESEAAAVARFREVLLEIQKSDALMSLTIVKPLQNDGTKEGITAVCFVDTEGSATVAFRGTDSYEAWVDDFEGAGKTYATPMQERAKEYINSLEYEDITVTGHSKGGNLAAFVAVLCSNVTRSVSFDGQGFSEAFHQKYSDLIAQALENKDIKTIAANHDLINTLLFSVGPTYYVNNEGEDPFGDAHYIFNLILNRDGTAANAFDENGNFSSFVEQDIVIHYIGVALDILAKSLPDATEEMLTDIGGAIASKVLTPRHETTFDEILDLKESIKEIYGEVTLEISSLTCAGVVNISSGLDDMLVGGITFDSDLLLQGIVKIIVGIALIIASIILAAVKVAIDMIDDIIDFLNGAGSFVEFIGGIFGQDWGWHIDKDDLADIILIGIIGKVYSLFETGGYPITGQKFIAREAGPELVGTINGRNAVVNNDQIVESVSRGVCGAFASALHGKDVQAPIVVGLAIDGRPLSVTQTA